MVSVCKRQFLMDEPNLGRLMEGVKEEQYVPALEKETIAPDKAIVAKTKE